MRHIAIVFSYQGGEFCGSQRQLNGPSVQGALEIALERVFKTPTNAILAGRTDAGVHATGMVARFSTENQSVPVEKVPIALNTFLPASVRVRQAHLVNENFHPRFSARSRVYRYRIEIASVPNPLLAPICGWIQDDLNVEKMRDAATAFVGQKDFKAWQSAGSPTPTTLREVKRLEIKQLEAFGSRILEIEIEADAFLYQMVRNIVGALIEAGKGRLERDEIELLTQGLDRKNCPPPAPPQGLCLVEVNY